MFFYNIGSQPILRFLSVLDYNTSFPRVCLLFTILLISIVCIGLRLTNVIIVHLTPQLVACPGHEYFEALVRVVIVSVRPSHMSIHPC